MVKSQHNPAKKVVGVLREKRKKYAKGAAGSRKHILVGARRIGLDPDGVESREYKA